MNRFINDKNIERFSGFSELYNDNRPIPPEILTKIILMYLNKYPDVVVDIGSGTGLSTIIWQEICPTIIGVEPNDDMRITAKQNTDAKNIEFIKGVSNNTSLSSNFADVITISQAFHWMDIETTLNEVHRVLKENGVFAIYDCDWPPSIDWIIEKSFYELRDKCDEICFLQEKHAIRNDKNSYINRINESKNFRFAKEVVFHSIEKCTSKRMIGIALSQGGIQDALKINTDIVKDIDDFCNLVESRCSGEFDIIFSYRLRIVIK